MGKTNFSNKPEDIVMRLASVLKAGYIIVGDNYLLHSNLQMHYSMKKILDIWAL